MKHYPNTKFACGYEWSIITLSDSFGNEVTAGQASELSKLAVRRFNQLCAEAGDPSICWIPQTSEVLGDCYGETTTEHHWSDSVNPIDADLDDLRNQAIQEVFDAGCGYNTPVSAEVNEILDPADECHPSGK